MTSSCNNGKIETAFKYETLRQKNMEKINEYYNKTLNKYTSQYNTYLQEKDRDEDYAEYLKNEDPTLRNLNNHLISIKSELNDYINEDYRNLQKQIKLYNKSEDELERTNSQINKANKMLQNSSNMSEARSDSYEENKKLNKINRYKHYAYIIVCVALLVIMIMTLFR